MKNDYIKLTLINFFYLVFLELIFKIFVIKVIDIGFLYIIIFSFPISIILSILMSISKNKWINKIISIILWFIIIMIFISETIYFSFYKTICGLGALSYGGQVMEFFNEIKVHIRKNIIPELLYIIPFIIIIVLTLKDTIKSNIMNYKKIFLLLFSSIALLLSSLSLYKKDLSSAYNLMFKTNDLLESTNKFGLLSAISLDAYKYSIGFEESLLVEFKRKYTLDSELEYNMTNIDFKELMQKETDTTINNMHLYFDSVEPTEQNKYTGIFAGKNLIFITAEAFYPIAVDENLTPTLYKLVNNGFVFNNFYQPIFYCSTSDGEFINNLSLLPGVSQCSIKSTINKYYPYSLGNVLKNYDYNAYAFHGWLYDYYERDKTHANLGYEYYGFDYYKHGYKNALEKINYSWPTSDIDVVNSSYDIINKDKPFVAYYMSISGHLEYNFIGNAIAFKNKKEVDNLKASDKIKAYIATQIEFDRSLEILMNKLREDGILDDTVIVISSDHYPYGLLESDIREYVDWMKDENFDLYKNNLVIYNSAMEENVIVDKYASSLDILPTILNLFGIKYDSRLLIGRDILSKSDGLVILNNKSWITDKGRYNALTNKFTSFTPEEISDDYIDSINEEVRLKFQMSKLIVSKDYYRKVMR